MPLSNISDISAVVTCKGRLEHLAQTLPALHQSGVKEIILVDYDCPDKCGLWAESKFPSVKVIYVSDKPLFNRSDARNTGARAASCEWLLFIDADVHPRPAFSSWAEKSLVANRIYLCEDSGSPPINRMPGIILTPRFAFEKVGGYDTHFIGWGGEDEELNWRLSRLGIRIEKYPSALFDLIPHSDALRTEFQPVQNRAFSKILNKIYFKIKRALLQRDEYKNLDELPYDLRSQLRSTIEAQLESLAEQKKGSVHTAQITFESNVPQPGGFLLREKVGLTFEVTVI